MVAFLTQDGAGHTARRVKMRHNRRSIITPQDFPSSFRSIAKIDIFEGN